MDLPNYRIDSKIDNKTDNYANKVATALENKYELLGRPQDPFTEKGAELVSIIIDMWSGYFPQESAAWIEQRKLLLKFEKSASEQLKEQTGGQLASIPYFVDKMMRVFFPQYKSWKRADWQRFVRKFPAFRTTNIRA